MKSILISNSNNIHHLFSHSLENLGYRVEALITPQYDAALQLTPVDKIGNIFKKSLGRPTDFKTQKQKKAQLFLENRRKALMAKHDHFHAGFFIAPQSFDRSFLQPLLQKTTKKIAYHWDGIHRFPDMTKNDDLFDRVYVFDPADADNQKYFFTTNCYFDDPAASYPKEFGLFYNTFYSKPKITVLKNLLPSLATVDSYISVRVFNEAEARQTQEELGTQVTITHQTEEYRALLNTTQKARVLLDIKAEEHNGLSFRFFEALCYRCKLITDNASVKEYDFYRPENIFVFNSNTKSEELQEFLNLPYSEIPENIRLRYYFPNWFERMMDY